MVEGFRDKASGPKPFSRAVLSGRSEKESTAL